MPVVHARVYYCNHGVWTSVQSVPALLRLYFLERPLLRKLLVIWVERGKLNKIRFRIFNIRVLREFRRSGFYIPVNLNLFNVCKVRLFLQRLAGSDYAPDFFGLI